MLKWQTQTLVAGLAATALLAGCNPLSMGVLTPIPVPPWTRTVIEENRMNKNDHRTPIMPPILDGFPAPLCEDPPTERETLRTMKRVARGVPFFYEEFRDGIQIDAKKIVDKIDPPRFFPLVGPAQLHHCHWKMTIYYTETIQIDYPYPSKTRKNRREVVYIDKDHLHLYVGNDPEVQREITREFTD